MNTTAALACILAAAPPAAAPALDSEHVALELLSDVETVTPGLEFQVGLRFELDDGWHVYWENPGDSGMPTRATLEAPEGFEVSGPRFPGPHRFALPGDIVSFGYERETVLFFDVKAPAELPADRPLDFSAEASWLVCKEVCLRGEDEATLELACAPAGEPARRRRDDALARQRALLPQPLERLEGAAVRWEDGERPALVVELPRVEGAVLALFAADERRLRFRDASSTVVDDRRVFRRTYSRREGPSAERPGVRGVVAVASGEERRYYSFDLDLPLAQAEDARSEEDA